MCWVSLPREGHHSGAGQGLWCSWDMVDTTAMWMDLLLPNTANAYCPGKCFCWKMSTCRYYAWQNPGSRTTSHGCFFSFKVFRILLQMCTKTWFLLSNLFHYSSSHLFGYRLIKHMLCLRDQISFDYQTHLEGCFHQLFYFLWSPLPQYDSNRNRECTNTIWKAGLQTLAVSSLSRSSLPSSARWAHDVQVTWAVWGASNQSAIDLCGI